MALTCALAVALTGACGNLFDTAAAVVGGRKITVDEVSGALDEYKATEEYQRLSAQGNIQAIQRQYQQAYLTQAIRRAVIEPRAADLGIEVTEDEVQDRLDEIRDEIGTQQGFEEAVKEQGLTLGQLEQLIHDSLLEGKLREEVTGDVGATSEQVEAFYEENIANYTRTHAQHILLRDFDLAKALARQLQSAPTKQLPDLFEQLAREHSIDQTTARRGGDLGFITAGELPEQFDKTAADLEIDEISDPVQSQLGYHVIRVVEREVTPLEDARIAIEEQLGEGVKEEAWQEWLRDAYRDADIRINSRFGELDPETQQVVDATAEDLPGAVDRPSPSPSFSLPG